MMTSSGGKIWLGCCLDIIIAKLSGLVSLNPNALLWSIILVLHSPVPSGLVEHLDVSHVKLT